MKYTRTETIARALIAALSRLGGNPVTFAPDEISNPQFSLHYRYQTDGSLALRRVPEQNGDSESEANPTQSGQTSSYPPLAPCPVCSYQPRNTTPSYLTLTGGELATLVSLIRDRFQEILEDGVDRHHCETQFLLSLFIRALYGEPPIIRRHRDTD